MTSSTPARPRPSLTLVLARLAGAQQDVLRKASTEVVKNAAMGGVLLTTAGVAGVSAGFALVTAVHVPIVAAVVAGLLWAFVIFNLDRMLIVSMTRQSGWLRVLLTAVPRLALAVVIGAVISVPLVLQIFQPEVQAELKRLHTDNKIQAQADLDRQYADVADLQKRVDQLQAVVAGRSQDAVTADPDVVAAQKKVADAQAAYETAAAAAQCELVGDCGTKVPGIGEAYRQAKKRADDALSALNDAKRGLADATSAARTRISTGETSSKEAAQRELDTLGPRLEQRKADRVADQAAIDRGEDRAEGLLAQLQALDRLTQRSPSMGQARLALFLLFLSIEVLPVLVKLLTLVGRPSLYDRVLEGDEQMLESRAGHERRVVAELDQHRADEQVRQGKIANTLLVDEQTKIAEKAIGAWGQVAAMRTDAELDRWLRQRLGQPPAAPGAVPTVAGPPARPSGAPSTPPGTPPAVTQPVAAPPTAAPPTAAPPTAAPPTPAAAPNQPRTVPILPSGGLPPAAQPAATPAAAHPAAGGPPTYAQYKARVGAPSPNGRQTSGTTPT